MPAASTRLRLRVSPGAQRAEIVGRHGDGWKVRVTAPPEDGRANDAVLRLVAETLALPHNAVTLVSGQGGREKTLDVAGIGPTQVARRLAAAAKDAGS